MTPPTMPGSGRAARPPIPDRSGRAGLYEGEVIARQHYDPSVPGCYRVEILHADPQIKVSGMLLRQARHGECLALRATESPNGELLTVTGDNARYVYLVAHYEPAVDVYYCHWPD